MIATCLQCSAACAHDFGSMRADVFVRPGGEYALVILADLDHVPSSVRREFTQALTKATTLEFDGAVVSLTRAKSEEVVFLNGAPTSQIRLEFVGSMPEAPRTVVFRTTLPLPEYYLVVHPSQDTSESNQWVAGGAASKPVELREPAAAESRVVTFFRSIQLGFEHIVPMGYDHILFVLGLCLLGTQMRPLLLQVTAFTVAHSITLALSLTGVVALSARVVEPLIALSIAYVAIENLFRARLGPMRVAVVFGFGLVHGLGFAGVLREVGIPADQFWTVLLGFNVGVELGQLSVILAAFVAVGLWCRGKDWYRSRVVFPASGCIAAFALCLTAQRLLWP